MLTGTLGERVVGKLVSTIPTEERSNTITSLHMMEHFDTPLVGTYMSNRKNVPKFSQKNLGKSESDFTFRASGVMATRWHDSKVVHLLSNCHSDTICEVTRRQRNGEKKTVPCPTAIAFYNKTMGGVDRNDQMATVYEMDRKSTKWWKKVFFRLTMMAVTDAIRREQLYIMSINFQTEARSQ